MSTKVCQCTVNCINLNKIYFNLFLFDRGTENIHLAVLHPRKLSIHSLVGEWQEVVCTVHSIHLHDIHGRKVS